MAQDIKKGVGLSIDNPILIKEHLPTTGNLTYEPTEKVDITLRIPISSISSSSLSIKPFSMLNMGFKATGKEWEPERLVYDISENYVISKHNSLNTSTEARVTMPELVRVNSAERLVIPKRFPFNSFYFDYEVSIPLNTNIGGVAEFILGHNDNFIEHDIARTTRLCSNYYKDSYMSHTISMRVELESFTHHKIEPQHYKLAKDIHPIMGVTNGVTYNRYYYIYNITHNVMLNDLPSIYDLVINVDKDIINLEELYSFNKVITITREVEEALYG